MRILNIPVVCMSLVAVAACSSSKSIVREESTVDLRCDAQDIAVEEVERPYTGVVRYSAEGCGRSITYTCGARVYVAGAPVGEKGCRRGDKPPLPMYDDSVGVGF